MPLRRLLEGERRGGRVQELGRETDVARSRTAEGSGEALRPRSAGSAPAQ